MCVIPYLPDGIQEAASQLSPGPHCNLHKQALYGPAENDGGGERAGSAGLPSSEETEAAAAWDQDCQSWKTQEPWVMLHANDFKISSEFRNQDCWWDKNQHALHVLYNSGTDMPAVELGTM